MQITPAEVAETLAMVSKQNLDIRTITLGINLRGCVDADVDALAIEGLRPHDLGRREARTHRRAARARVRHPHRQQAHLRHAHRARGRRLGDATNYVPFAVALDRAAKAVGVNFIGGFSALVQKGMTDADRRLIAAIPEALAVTDLVCSSVNVGSTKAGINMDAVALLGRTVKAAAERTADCGGFGCAKLVVFCNAVEDNPFMAGAFHGSGEAGRRGERRRVRPRRGARGACRPAEGSRTSPRGGRGH